MENDDTPQGGESLSIEQAAAAFTKATAPKEVQQDHTEDARQDEGDNTTDDELQAADEGASETDEGDIADGEDAEQGEDDESQPESEQGRFVADNAKVRLADGTITTVNELKRGFLREADYTRKTQESSARLKDTETLVERTKQREQQLEQQSTYMAELIRSIVPDEPDIALTDPSSPNFDMVAYSHQMAQRQAWIKHLQYLDGQRQQTEQERAAQSQQAHGQKLQNEWNALLEKVPAFKDEAKAKAFVADVHKYGTGYGFTPDELSQLGMDHRQAVVMRKAILWDKLQANKATVQKKVEGRPPVTKGGKRLNPSEHRARAASDAVARLQKSGSVEDAAAAYLATRK